MEKGINRIAWNLRRDAFKRPQLTPPQGEGFGGGGPEVPQGKYTIRMKLGNHEVFQTVEVLPDPRVPPVPEAQQAKYHLILVVGAKLEVAAEAVNRIQKIRGAIDLVLGQIKDRKDSVALNLKKQSAGLKKTLTGVADQFIDDQSNSQGIVRQPNTVSARLGGVARSLGTSWDPPTPTQLTYLRQAEEILARALKDFNKVFSEEVASYRAAVEQAKLPLVPESDTLAPDWKPKKRE